MRTKPNIRDFDSLQKRIEDKITGIMAIENDFPGVIIIHQIAELQVLYMSQWGRDWLGVSMEELRLMGTEYFNRFFNPDDTTNFLPKIIGLLERNKKDEMVSYFQQVRQSPQHNWTWYASCVKVILRDDEDRPVLTQTTAIPIDAKHFFAGKAERLLEENNFLRRNTQIFNSLTKREKEILRLMALGQSAGQIADELNIAGMTAATHRKNIRIKLKAHNNYDITRFAQAFNLI